MFRANPGRKRGDISAKRAAKSGVAKRMLDDHGPQGSGKDVYKPKKSGASLRQDTGLSEKTVNSNSAWVRRGSSLEF